MRVRERELSKAISEGSVFFCERATTARTLEKLSERRMDERREENMREEERKKD